MSTPPSLPTTLTSFEPRDFRSLAEIYRPAFFQTRLTNFILEGVSPSACDEWFIERLRRAYHDKHEKGNDGVEILVAKRGEECLGFAWWIFSPDIEERVSHADERFWPEGTGSRDAVEYMERLDTADEVCTGRHWHLGVLGVHPEAQGQGIGRILTQWGIDRAKSEDADAFLVATEVGRPLYTKMGFVHIGEPLVAPQKPDVVTWPMVLRLRKP
ncbi:hypothetical protein JCM16303_000367 [Sporobolomyces ruberrimus]